MARDDGRAQAVTPPRLIVPSLGGGEGAEIALPKEEARHVKSRRLLDGDEVILLDGSGGRARAKLARRGTAALLLGLEESGPRPHGEPSRAVTVLLAASDPMRVEWAVEKGTECGAAAFLIFTAERSQASHVAALARRGDRLRRVAAEAVKQCDRSVVPGITGPLPLEEALTASPRPLLVATPGAPRVLVPASAGPLAVAIGPEGGLTDDEVDRFRRAGAAATGLGPRILRLETAVVVLLASLVDAP